MENDYSAPAKHRVPLIQAALALLVASSLVAFSVLAFRTGFAEDRGRNVTATDIGAGGRAVVLPSLGGDERAPARPAADDARIAISPTTAEPVVLGTRVDEAGSQRSPNVDRHDRRRGRGHDKARGRGHHKNDREDKNRDKGGDGKQVAARHDDDDDEDHGDDEGDDRRDDSERSGSRSDGSRSGQRHRGSRGHSGSGGHSGGSN